jgi:hypothetical protein
MTDNGELTPEHLRWLEEFHRYFQAKSKMQVWNLAARLKIWRIVYTNSDELAAASEMSSERLLICIARKFQQDLLTGDSKFFQTLTEACKALEEDRFFEKLNVETQAILLYLELRKESGQPPTTNQVLKRLEEVLKGPLDRRQQNRAKKALAPIYKGT